LPCMDDDELRRGRPTVHVRFGVRAAVLAGAALMPLAIRVVSRSAIELGLDDRRASELIGALASASGGSGMVGGQLLDLQAEGVTIGADELERIHRGKTARLIAASCAIGGLAADAATDTVQRLTRYGEALGLAFQTVDDILDVTGSAQRMGKRGGRDEALGKATTPSLLGLEGARERAGRLGAEALRQIEPLSGTEGLRALARLVLERDR
ncbi:MAG: polyprenyl synthetase family protein, partial [Gemmatimonadetes bacterium]|nr:polyprenyl synthetase family protein [Gemmatimonadota bacterium]